MIGADYQLRLSPEDNQEGRIFPYTECEVFLNDRVGYSMYDKCWFAAFVMKSHTRFVVLVCDLFEVFIKRTSFRCKTIESRIKSLNGQICFQPPQVSKMGEK